MGRKTISTTEKRKEAAADYSLSDKLQRKGQSRFLCSLFDKKKDTFAQHFHLMSLLTKHSWELGE